MTRKTNNNTAAFLNITTKIFLIVLASFCFLAIFYAVLKYIFTFRNGTFINILISIALFLLAVKSVGQFHCTDSVYNDAASTRKALVRAAVIVVCLILQDLFLGWEKASTGEAAAAMWFYFVHLTWYGIMLLRKY